MKNNKIIEAKSIAWLFYSYMRYDCWILTVEESKILPIKVSKIYWLAKPLKFIGTCSSQGPELVSRFFLCYSRCLPLHSGSLHWQFLLLPQNWAGMWQMRKTQNYMAPVPPMTSPLLLSLLPPTIRPICWCLPSIQPPAHIKSRKQKEAD